MKAIKERSNTVLNTYASNEKLLYNDTNVNSCTFQAISTKVNSSLLTERQGVIIRMNESRELSDTMK